MTFSAPGPENVAVWLHACQSCPWVLPAPGSCAGSKEGPSGGATQGSSLRPHLGVLNPAVVFHSPTRL